MSVADPFIEGWDVILGRKPVITPQSGAAEAKAWRDEAKRLHAVATGLAAQLKVLAAQHKIQTGLPRGLGPLLAIGGVALLLDE